MIQLTPQMRILLAVNPADFRCGIDGLVRVCREVLAGDPFTGTVFVFRNRRARALRLLVFDGQGFWLCHKRLSSGKFHWWPDGTSSAAKKLEVPQLQLLLWNGDPDRANASPPWRRVASAE
jgi:transposase